MINEDYIGKCNGVDYFVWATAITCIINMAQNKADVVHYKGAMSKGKVKAKAQVSVKRQSLEIHTVRNNTRPQHLEKMGRDSDPLNLWNQETCGSDFLNREEVKLYAEWGVQSWTGRWRRVDRVHACEVQHYMLETGMAR